MKPASHSGFGAGFLCAVLSTAAADFFVLSPRFSFVPESTADLVDLLLFGPLAICPRWRALDILVSRGISHSQVAF